MQKNFPRCRPVESTAMKMEMGSDLVYVESSRVLWQNVDRFTGARACNKIQVSPLFQAPYITPANNKAQVCLAVIEYCIFFPSTLDTGLLRKRLFSNTTDCFGLWTKPQ